MSRRPQRVLPPLLAVLVGLASFSVVRPGAAAPAAPAPEPRPDPAVAELRFAEARLAVAGGGLAAAVGHCAAALAANPRHDAARHLRGVLLARLGRWPEAERDLQALAWRRPRDVPLLRLLARAFAAQDKWMWAARQLQRAVALAPREGAVWLAYGHALYRLGEKDEAHRALGRAAALGPRAVTNRARVLQALLHRQAGRLREARHLVDGLEGPAADAAAALTRRLYAAEGRAERGLALTLRLGTSYDSNVSMDPTDQRGSGSEGWLLDLGARLQWHAFTWGRHAVGVGGSLLRTFALNWWSDGSCVPDYSLLAASVAPWYALRFTTGRVDHELRVGYRGQVITLDGSCQPDDGLYVFSERHAGALGWEVRWSDRTATHINVDAGATRYHQQVRDQAGAALDVGQSIFLARRRVKLYPSLHLRYEAARGDYWSVVALRPSLALSALLPGKLDLLFWVDAELQRYPDSQGTIPWLLGRQEDRGDLILRSGLSLGRALTTWLRTDLAYRYRWNRSNVPLYDYQRHVVGLSLTANVDLWKPAAAGGRTR